LVENQRDAAEQHHFRFRRHAWRSLDAVAFQLARGNHELLQYFRHRLVEHEPVLGGDAPTRSDRDDTSVCIRAKPQPVTVAVLPREAEYLIGFTLHRLEARPPIAEALFWASPLSVGFRSG